MAKNQHLHFEAHRFPPLEATQVRFTEYDVLEAFSKPRGR
jgi:hypothetical protein